MAEAEDPKPRKGKLRTALMVVGLLLGEAVLILGAITLFSGPPEVQADSGLEGLEVPDEEKIVELLLVDERLPNSKRGVTYLYDTEVYIQVQRKHQMRVGAELEQFRNEIKAELTAVWRTSEPHHFDEPQLQSLTRKISALMDSRFGNDIETGDRIVEKVVIVMGTGLRVDS